MKGVAGREQPGRFQWYVRQEPAGPWRIAACEPHGAALQAHRFVPAGAAVELSGGRLREATECYLCRTPELLHEVEGCSCETDSARCPVHQNIGCGG